MAAKVHRAVLLLAVAVSLIQARRRPVHVVSGTIQKDRRQPQDTYADPWMTESMGHWGSSPEESHSSMFWGSDEKDYWEPDPEPHWGSDTNDYWKAESPNHWGSDTNGHWGAEANSHWGNDLNVFWETEANHPMGGATNWGDNDDSHWASATSNHWPMEEPSRWETETNLWGDHAPNSWGDHSEHLGAAQDNFWGSSQSDAWKESDSTGDFPNYPDGFFDQFPPYTESSFDDYPDYSDYDNNPQNPFDYYDYYKEYNNYPQYSEIDYDDSQDNTDYTRDYPEYFETTFKDYPEEAETSFNDDGDYPNYPDYSDYSDYSDYPDYPFGNTPDRGRPFGNNRDQIFFGDNPNGDVQLLGGSTTTALEELITVIRNFDGGRVPTVLRNLASGRPLFTNSDPSPVVGVQDFSDVSDTYNVGTDFGFVNAEDEGPRKMPEMPTEGGEGGGSEDEMTDMMLRHFGFDVTNPHEVSEGKLFQMDILMTKPQMDEAMSAMELDATPKKGISDSRFLWPSGPDGFPLVPYTFGDDKVKQEICKQAMDEWEAHSCIKFEELEGSSKDPHIRFEQREGCYSYIGRIWFFEGQLVSIGKYCDMFSAVHEVGHALGLFHEQSRTDRDDFIHVNTDNIQRSRKHNFEKAKFEFVNNHNVKYDYTSIMHYKGKTYYNGGHSLSTINPLYQELLGSMDRLSFRDKLLINRMYSCIDKWVKICNLPSDPCENSGYTGADCRCVCPPGTSGDLCQTVTGDYYEMYMSGCSEILTEDTVVESENYPNNIPEGVRCTKLIVPPECHSVELMFYNFRMYPRIECQNLKKCCYWDGLEIRTSDPYMGDWYCGREITAGQKFTSDGNMTLYYHAVSAYSQGFRARLRFPAIEGCQIEAKTGSEKANPGTTLTHLKKMTIVNSNTVVSNSLPSKSSRVCGIQKEFGNLHWNSPAFGSGKYPTDFSCGFTIAPKIPAPLSVHFDFFELQPRLNKFCMDSVSIIKPFGVQRRFCGSEATSFVLPSSSLTAIFNSDEKYTSGGFNITLEQKASPCHKILRTGIAGGRITTPGYPRYHGEGRACEWWIIAPENKRVKISVSGKSIQDCRRNYLVVDLKGSRTYSKDSSERFCGENNLPFTLVSSGNEMDILYKSSLNSKGFEIVYGVV